MHTDSFIHHSTNVYGVPLCDRHQVWNRDDNEQKQCVSSVHGTSARVWDIDFKQISMHIHMQVINDKKGQGHWR